MHAHHTAGTGVEEITGDTIFTTGPNAVFTTSVGSTEAEIGTR